jgi:hypothetical protein
MNTADRVSRWSTALAGVCVAAVAAVVSYEHASALVRAHGEAGWTGSLIPLTMDGLIYASSMVMLDWARRGAGVPAPARWLLGMRSLSASGASPSGALAEMSVPPPRTGHVLPPPASVLGWGIVAGPFGIIKTIFHRTDPLTFGGCCATMKNLGGNIVHACENVVDPSVNSHNDRRS